MARRKQAAAFGLGALLWGTGCEEADTKRQGDGSQSAPLYVFTNEVYGDADSITYVNALTSLDVGELDLRKALEFPGGRATVVGNDGKVFVAGPESQVVERYEIHDDGSFHKTGQLSFADYGIASVTLDDWGCAFISPTKAYLFNAVEGTAVVWNPRSMEILGEVDSDGHDLVREGWDLNSSGAVVQGDRLFQFVFWNNWDEFTFSEEQYLLVYDTKSDRLIDMIPESRCPALSNRVELDEDGNMYFSNWIWNVGATLVSDAPKSCVLRIRAGEESFDEDWLLSYADVADGREGAVLGYLDDRQALFSVFHEERTSIQSDTVPTELVSELDWRLWTLDLDSREASPLEGLGDLTWNAGAVSTYHVGGRTFILVPGDDWSVTNVYEIEDGRAHKRFEAGGWSYQFFKLR